MLKRRVYKGTNRRTSKGRHTNNTELCRSPMYPSNNALYLDVKKILRSAWEAKAAREGKTIECVVGEEIRHAIELGADARLEQTVKKSLLEH